MDDASAILKAIEEVRDEAREAREHRNAVDARLDQHEAKIAQQGVTLVNLGTEVAAHTAQLAKLADAQVSVAKSSAIASELAAQALARVNTAQDETRKMVESAMTIQKDAIGGAVREALGPVALEIDSLKKNDVSQAETLANQDKQLATAIGLLSTLAKWQNHWAVKLAIALAGIIGAGVAGYLGGGH